MRNKHKSDSVIFGAIIFVLIIVLVSIGIGISIPTERDLVDKCISQKDYKINSSVEQLDGSVKWEMMPNIDRIVIECRSSDLRGKTK